MSHEIDVIAFKCQVWKMRLPSVTSVPLVSRKLGLALASHIPNNSGDLVLRFCNATLGACMFLDASVMRRTLCLKCCSIVDMCAERTGQLMRTTFIVLMKYILLILARCVLGLVVTLVLALEMQDNMPQYIIHLRLLYNQATRGFGDLERMAIYFQGAWEHW